jgi:hypothetical protein
VRSFLFDAAGRRRSATLPVVGATPACYADLTQLEVSLHRHFRTRWGPSFEMSRWLLKVPLS